ncbi:MAG TPA: helix-turn-helix transcriptional regulator [Solirubrobacterales bacterium]|nr:helix-turn-helix transcriptional regulator [Solirubrobacterales bacterium]
MTRRSLKPPHSSPLLVDLGIAVKALRREADLTQKQRAERSGLHEAYISQIDCGAGNPAWTTLSRLCEGLGVPRWVLVKRIDDLEGR